MCSLVPSSGPVLCRDEMEEWSASEANLFEEALEKYGKDFNDIRNDFVSKLKKRTVLYHIEFLSYSMNCYITCYLLFYNSFLGKL